jgi:hypothetical protein
MEKGNAKGRREAQNEEKRVDRTRMALATQRDLGHGRRHKTRLYTEPTEENSQASKEETKRRKPITNGEKPPNTKKTKGRTAKPQSGSHFTLA